MSPEDGGILFHISMKTGEEELKKDSFSLGTMSSPVPFCQNVFCAVLLAAKANKNIIHHSSVLFFPRYL